MEKMRMSHEEALEKAQELVSKMTLQEKSEQLTYQAAANERLNIPRYNWWNEGLHGVARAGLATVFPQAIGLAAMFDDEFLERIADAISTEGRAKYNENIKHGDRGIYKGITFWSPNVNIFRDPRWGRGQETYGEDPYLTSKLGVAFVKGLQGKGKYLKIAACAKHFAVHSGPEALRHEFDAQVSQKDLYETYLPAFEACVKEGDVEAVMGAYNRTNGEPCCGSKTLLNDILREKWGFKGHVVSDCWAILDFHMNHRVTSTATESAALAIKNGCDLNCGNVYLQMMLAYKEGLVSEEDITRSCERLMATRYRLGMFDDDCEYNNIPYEENDSKEHNEMSLEAARKSMVLLKNDGILPLDKSKLKSVAVIGPNADSELMLSGNYFGTASKYTTLINGIQDAIGDSVRVYYSEGCHLYKDKIEDLAESDDRLAEAVTMAEHSDVTILCLGLDSAIEGEQGDAGNSAGAGDKLNLELPAPQKRLLKTILDTGKPVIVVLGVGSAMTLSGMEDRCSAILNAWYPGSHGGEALADLLFGKYSPSGKLPVTFYKNCDNLPAFTDYSMKGRTYRYMEEESLYPFGYGLTYSKVKIDNLNINKCSDSDNYKVDIDIENIGDYNIDEVLQCYIKDLESKYAVRNYNLCAFKRVSLNKGEKKTVSMIIDKNSFTVVDDDGNRFLDSSKFKIYAGICGPDKRSIELTNVKPLEGIIEL
ncbi:glycoside hydrolase family 3 C-terminal domain-containing protein [Clostridium sp. SM-530-WT-3G]|uniref:glycoside hydrolase family 3 C-terminal domain-containing protein n=1 Tax=Clostridium sp. SM-530-WT-3G TaxID=2725303 RepID=UPI00145F5602|nr:glycoside hydrolase family 3 C-terminal domain-containing protein [Clostridium sp. SM-530-WT-3G]NME82155.1 glycoside hydrolase family 3 protein [Clostridium sp. SM-530-WT-3G]